MMPAPVQTTFVNGVNPFKVKRPTHCKTKEQRIVESIKYCGADTSLEISKRTGIDRSTVIAHLNQLATVGKLEVIKHPNLRSCRYKYIVCEALETV